MTSSKDLTEASNYCKILVIASQKTQVLQDVNEFITYCKQLRNTKDSDIVSGDAVNLLDRFLKYFLCLSRDSQIQVANNVVYDLGLPKVLSSFFVLLISNRKTYLFRMILNVWDSIYLDFCNITLVEVVSVVKLSSEDLQDVEQLLRQLGVAKYEIRNVIDKSIIGGVILKIGSKVIDNSLKKKLNILSRSISDMGVAEINE